VSAELDVTAAAEAPALREVETVVVVVAGDEVVGIWDGESLAGAVLSGGASRSAKDWGLMGVVDQIPKVRRPCGHNEGAASCLVVVEFPEKPDEMPQCPNPHGLSPHRFVW